MRINLRLKCVVCIAYVSGKHLFKEISNTITKRWRECRWSGCLFSWHFWSTVATRQLCWSRVTICEYRF